jgi:hypothetical protein
MAKITVNQTVKKEIEIEFPFFFKVIESDTYYAAFEEDKALVLYTSKNEVYHYYASTVLSTYSDKHKDAVIIEPLEFYSKWEEVVLAQRMLISAHMTAPAQDETEMLERLSMGCEITLYEPATTETIHGGLHLNG